MKIYFLREETTYGPFFSSKEKVRKYLEKQQEDDPWFYKEGVIEEIMAGRHPYTNLTEVELDKTRPVLEVIFDG